MGQEEVECERPTNYNFSEGDLQRLMCPILDVTMLAKPFICDSLAQVQLLTQVSISSLVLFVNFLCILIN